MRTERHKYVLRTCTYQVDLCVKFQFLWMNCFHCIHNIVYGRVTTLCSAAQCSVKVAYSGAIA